MSRHLLDENLGHLTRSSSATTALNAMTMRETFGEAGWSDAMILSHLHGSKLTFHTRDADFFAPTFCHATYSLIFYDVEPDEVAAYMMRVIRHPHFNTHAKRLGKVIRVSPTHIEFYAVAMRGKQRTEW